MELLLGDCKERLTALETHSIGAVVTDPPYGLNFMGKKWDHDVPSVEIWREVFRVLKPGGHLLAFGGTRTYHRLVVAIEDAGFEIRDQVQWIYGQGFPKSLDISKATAPATPAAKEWQGWGTALKPANEPICLARKPISEKTVAANVLKWGTGGLNIDGCRIGSFGGNAQDYKNPNRFEVSSIPLPEGRFPSNVILDEAAGEMLDGQTGELGNNFRKKKTGTSGGGMFGISGHACLEDTGGASRFFYCAKASKSERNLGLEDHNFHPTVKPVKLMKYLIKLITRPGGVVLDPFMGSGSTGVAAKNLGFEFVGIELSPEYFEIARNRIDSGYRQCAQSLSQTDLQQFIQEVSNGI